LSKPVTITQAGPGFVVDSDNRLSCLIINRRITIPCGLLCLIISGGILYFEWQGAFTNHPWFSHVALWSLGLLLIGLLSIGIRKQVDISCAHNRVWLEAGWFCFSLSPYITSQWSLDRFDRIIIFRCNRFGLEASQADIPQQNNWNLRFQVKLTGDHEITINSYGSYQDARRLSDALSGLTGFPVRDNIMRLNYQ